MDIFPEINPFKITQAHTLVDFLILGSFLVQIEGFFPVSLVEWRQGTGHYFPFGDRKPAAGEPGDAPNNNLKKDHDQACPQP